MGLKHKLKKWTAAELIEASQASAILKHEKQGIGTKYFRGLIGLALLTIFGGLAMIIASNWAEITGATKLIGHFILSGAAACTVWQGKIRNNYWLREGASFIFAALNMTLIVLIGQVFQLNGTVESALLLWILITSPMLFIFGESRMIAILWLAGFLATTALNLEDLIERFDVSYATENSLYLMLISCIPAGLLFSAMTPKFKTLRPEWQHSYLIAATTLYILAGLAASFGWYDDSDFLNRQFKNLYWLPTALFTLWAVGLYGVSRILQSATNKALCQFAAIAALSALISFLPNRPEIDTMATIHFVLFAGVIGYFAIPLGLHGFVTLAILLITMRLFAFYIELTGPMFAMGVGMIVTGIILLVVLRLALKLDKKVKAKLFGEEE
ncbi:MAG: DUF2157 domain-containing protein [Alphaproteobacteria bacterium]|nr:DUF2157 domain-containing protein [Alphaproteobacteria bacterium]